MIYLKARRVFLLCAALIVAFAAACAETDEEESIVPNQLLTVLEQATQTTGDARSRAAALTGDPSAWSAAMERGREFRAAINDTVGECSVLLEGDVAFEEMDEPVVCGKNRRVSVDLNGHILYGARIEGGEYTFRNGVVVDLRCEEIGEPFRITVEEDCMILKDCGTSAIDLTNPGDFILENRGTVEGIRRIRYQNGRSVRFQIINEGLIYSDTFAISVRSFHQNTTIMIRNDGILAGRYTGLDIHTSGGSLLAEGEGPVIGILGPDIEIPKVVFRCPVIADDLNLGADERQRIIAVLDPYGEKQVMTGIAFDLQVNHMDYWSTWLVTGTVWASRGILRISFPKNEKIKGEFSPVIREGSPSREILYTATFSRSTHELNGLFAERNIRESGSMLSLDGSIRNGATVSYSLYCRYLEENGSRVVYLSTQDTRWSHLAGIRDQNDYQWQTPENGSLDSPEPVTAKNDHFQLKGAMQKAGEGGIVLVDKDVTLSGDDGELVLRKGVTLTGDGNAHIGGKLRFIVEKEAALTSLNFSGETLRIGNMYLSGDTLRLDRIRAGKLILDRVAVTATDTEADSLEIYPVPGEAAFAIRTNRLLVETCDRQYAVYNFPEDIGTADPGNASIRIITGSISLRKKFIFTGQSGTENVDVCLLQDAENRRILVCYEPDLLYFYTPYLNMLDLKEFRPVNGNRPKVRFMEEDGTIQHQFILEEDGSWRLADG